MKVRVLLVFLFLCKASFAQELRSVDNKGRTFYEQFTVLASDKKIKHGEYKRYSLTAQLTMEGKYENDQKIGEWNFYLNGELEHTFDFSIKQLKYSKNQRELYVVEVNDTLQEKILDTPPAYLGSKPRLNEELNKVMSYPLQARRMGVDGLVIASVWIDVNGEITTKIISGISSECDKELLKGLSKIEKDWVAGTLAGAPIKSLYVFGFLFKLSDTDGSVSMTVK